MPQLSDMKIHTKLKLSALWTSTMFCYIYCDYFELYVPGKLESMLQGKMGPLGNVTQALLMGTSISMAIICLMIFLSVALPARLNRILNIVLGTYQTLLMTLFIYMADWYFYKSLATIEALLTALIAWSAWRWPRVETTMTPNLTD